MYFNGDFPKKYNASRTYGKNLKLELLMYLKKSRGFVRRLLRERQFRAIEGCAEVVDPGASSESGLDPNLAHQPVRNGTKHGGKPCQTR